MSDFDVNNFDMEAGFMTFGCVAHMRHTTKFSSSHMLT